MHHRIQIDDPAFETTLGRVIRDARRLAGWTQAQLASRAGTTQSTISRIELGIARELDVGVVARVLAALGYRGGLELDARISPIGSASGTPCTRGSWRGPPGDWSGSAGR